MNIAGIIKDYISQQNPLSFYIIKFLLGLFLVWLFILLWMVRKILKSQREIRDGADVSEIGHKLRDKIQNASDHAVEQTFNEFCDARHIRSDKAIGRHLKVIFNAGLSGSQLDLGELLRHTTDGIFRGNQLLRSVLSTFIIIGLLGTLFGLASSVSELNLNSPPTDQTSEQMSDGLNHLFSNLKSVFAPSICGVFLTILGVLLYSYYLWFYCHRLKDRLDYTTIHVWVPELFPTTAQKINEEAIAAAGKLAQATGDLKQFTDKSSQLHENIDSAIQCTGELSKSTQVLNDFSDKFSDSTSKLVSFQDELKGLYRQLKDEYDQFQKATADLKKLSEDSNQKLLLHIKAQNEQLGETMSTAKATEERLKGFVESAASANAMLGKQFGESLEKVSGNLLDQQEILNKHIQEAFKTGDYLKGITEQMETLTAKNELQAKDLREKFNITIDKLARNQLQFGARIQETTEAIRDLKWHLRGRVPQSRPQQPKPQHEPAKGLWERLFGG